MKLFDTLEEIDASTLAVVIRLNYIAILPCLDLLFELMKIVWQHECLREEIVCQRMVLLHDV